MKRARSLRVCAIAFLALLGASSLAHAQATRTWVSGVGDDANPCSRTAPCKTFAGAISKTAPGGEIDVLDPGGFGALTITKAISIEADGLIAGVLVSGTNGFVISAAATDTVMIRGITFEGLGTGLDGIQVLQAGKVTIENCEINGFTGFGIDFKPANANSQLFVTNTTVRHNGNASAGGGIIVAPSPVSTVGATLTNVRLQGNVVGLKVLDGGEVTVQQSTVTDSAFAGLNVAVAGTSASLFLDHVVSASNNTIGLGASSSGAGTATARIANSSFLLNGTGGVVQGTGGVIGTFGTNNIAGNGGTDIGGTLTPLGLH
jgi:hypothetical protein